MVEGGAGPRQRLVRPRESEVRTPLKGEIMGDVLLGKKFSEKDLAKAMAQLTPELQVGESPVCAVQAIGMRPPIDTLILTNQRIVTMYRGRGVDFRYPISDVRRLAFSGSKLIIRTPDDEVLEVCRVKHASDDAPLIRQVFSSIGGLLDGSADIVRDPTASVTHSPRTKEKAMHEGLLKVDEFLEDGEQLLYALQDVNDWFFVTNRRLITITGIRKTQAQDMLLEDYVRVAVEQDRQKWLVAAADPQQQYALLAKLRHEDEARWLARSIEAAYPHMTDPWRDEIRGFVDSVGLSYALESILPLLWPRVAGEQLVSAFGGGEDLLIFTTRRLVALPDLVAVPLQDVVAAEFALGRSDHYSYSGQLVQAAFGMTAAIRVSDGRRFNRVQFIADSEQQFNAAIPSFTRALQDLSAAGYPVTEGQEWVEQTQSPPPPPRQGPTSFVGYSIEF